MSNPELTSVLFVLLLLVGFAQLLGYLFCTVAPAQGRWRNIGRRGVWVLRFWAGCPSAAHIIESAKHQGNILDFVYWLGLLLLMFLSGAEMQQLFSREERRDRGLA